MKAIFNHCNINVTNLEKSIHFYKEALFEKKKQVMAVLNLFI